MLIGTNIYVRPLSLDDAEGLLTFQKENKDFFEKFLMERDNSYFSIEK